MAYNAEYQYVNEESISERLKCTICMKPFIDPVSTSCRDKKHVFCRHCIAEWVNRAHSCPTCRQELHAQDLTPIAESIFIDLLDEILVKCLHCKQTGLQRGSFNDHLKNVCSKATVACRSSDLQCAWIGPRDQLEEHLNHCLFGTLRPLVTQLRMENEKLKQRIEEQRDKQMKQLIVENVPKGVIWMWSGTLDSIPVGFALCDGKNGTPNLFDRFIVSVCDAQTNPGSKGGAHTYILTTEQMPSHSHTGSGTTSTDGAHTHTLPGYHLTLPGTQIPWYNWGNPAHPANNTNTTSSNGGHTHTYNFTTSTTGEGASIDNRPLFYSLAFIMKL